MTAARRTNIVTGIFRWRPAIEHNNIVVIQMFEDVIFSRQSGVANCRLVIARRWNIRFGFTRVTFTSPTMKTTIEQRCVWMANNVKRP